MGLNAIPHIPCSFKCKKSISQGIWYMNIGRKYGFSEEMDWLKEILSWPIEWNFLDGIEEIRTPFFRESFDIAMGACKKDHKKYVVRLNRTAEI